MPVGTRLKFAFFRKIWPETGQLDSTSLIKMQKYDKILLLVMISFDSLQ
jgi:hypothetical protein